MLVLGGCWQIDLMTEPGDQQSWEYRRDPRVTAPRDQMISRTDAGVPYLRPHGVLLYKAARTRAKDEADLRSRCRRAHYQRAHVACDALSTAWVATSASLRGATAVETSALTSVARRGPAWPPQLVAMAAHAPTRMKAGSLRRT